MVDLTYLLQVELSGLADGVNVQCKGMKADKRILGFELEQIYEVRY